MDPQVRAEIQILNEQVASLQAGGAGGAAFALSQPMAGFDLLASVDADTVLTAAQVSGGTASQDLLLTGGVAFGAGRARQMPTVAALIAAVTVGPPAQAPVVGRSYRFRFINQQAGAFAATITTNTGWTLTGTMTVAQNTWREFVLTFTNVGTGTEAATLQSVAVGTIS